MSTEHIVKSYDEDLKRLDNLIAEMGGLAENQLASAMDALIRRDSALAERVIVQDDRIDTLEREVDNLATTMLALRQPMAEDLRIIIAALRISSVIERVGDYAKNIAKRTVALTQAPPVGPTKTIARMSNLVQGRIKTVLDSYVERDAGKAEDVRLGDSEVDALYTSLFRELLTYMMEDPRNITSCTHLLFVAKNIERIGDHATNIAKNVLYVVKGGMPEGRRPKGDASPYTVLGPDDTPNDGSGKVRERP